MRPAPKASCTPARSARTTVTQRYRIGGIGTAARLAVDHLRSLAGR